MDGKKIALGLAAFAGGAAAWVLGTGRYGDKIAGALKRLPARASAAAGAVTGAGGSAEHVPTDLLADAPVTTATRAPEAFRPDPTAVPTAEEREALRPATGPAPSLAADRGSVLADAVGAA